MPSICRTFVASLRHQAVYLGALALIASLAIATVTRVVLLVWKPGELDLSPAALLDGAARGLAGDLAFGLALAALSVAIGALIHRGPRRAGTGAAVLGAAAAAMIFMLLFVAVAEFLFWDEFSTRFNFIAVDYLIYTTEVIGNIHESYPLPSILGAIAAISLVCGALIARLWPVQRGAGWRLPARLGASAAAVLTLVLATRAGIWSNDALTSDVALLGSVTSQELARNGPLGFVSALRDNSLSFERFYATVDRAEFARLTTPWPRPAQLSQDGARQVVRVGVRQTGEGTARPTAAGRPRHLVVIQVESLSAEYLGAFGNDRGLTPYLDRLAGEGVLFTQMYATGTRTVRGLEALSAALPPLPGQSVLRRPGNEHLTTLGAVLRDNGFASEFLYGGYGYFDNMNGFFADNGYRVQDRRDLPADQVGFANVWGVADEYLFDHAIRRLDAVAAGGGRGFLHLMTTSNHRPYTYPEGRIDIPSKTGRDGAVKYADWAIGHFIEAARAHPWFDDTLFVIVADHCASVAGRTSLPPDRYLIPAILYAPRHLAPKRVDLLSSQIDLAPTLVAWLGLDDHGRFFGQDLFGPAARPRAFLGNYQEVGLLTQADDGSRDLVVLAPRRKVSQYRVNVDQSINAVPVRAELAKRAIAAFQQASEIFSSGRYRHVPGRLAESWSPAAGGS